MQRIVSLFFGALLAYGSIFALDVSLSYAVFVFFAAAQVCYASLSTSFTAAVTDLLDLTKRPNNMEKIVDIGATFVSVWFVTGFPFYLSIFLVPLHALLFYLFFANTMNDFALFKQTFGFSLGGFPSISQLWSSSSAQASGAGKKKEAQNRKSRRGRR